MGAVVVTPTYNEADNIRDLIHGLRLSHPGISIVVVDDGSPDGTAEKVRILADAMGEIHLISRPGKGGLASAYLTGFDYALSAGFETIIQMDADLSHNPADLPRLLAAEGDLVLGSRYIPGGGTRNWPLHRRALSRFGSIYARRILGLGYHDLTGGFKAWSAPVLREVLRERIDSDGYVFQVEMTLRAHEAGHAITEIPIIFTERLHGQSKMSMKIACEAALRVPLLRLK